MLLLLLIKTPAFLSGGFFIPLCVKWLEHVAEYHKEWLAVMHSFGAKNQSEDFVQEVYIRLAERSDKEKLYFKNGKLNKSYVYFALKHLWISHKRKQREYTEIKNKVRMIVWNFEDLELHKRDKVMNSNINKKKGSPLYTDSFNKIENNILLAENKIISSEYIKKKYEIILEKIDQEINSWHWYDRMLFLHYVESGKSIRDLADETKISRGSIFQTLKNCKEKIKITVGEDWEDFKNKEYELIK